MVNRNSEERFFASAMKRILVSLSCVSLVASTELPIAFAASSHATSHAARHAASHAPAKTKVAPASKKRVAIASRIDSVASDVNAEIQPGTKSGATASASLPITAPSWSEVPARASTVKHSSTATVSSAFKAVTSTPKATFSPIVTAKAAASELDKSVVEDKYVAQPDTKVEPDTKAAETPVSASTENMDLKPVETPVTKTEPTAAVSETPVTKTEPTAAVSETPVTKTEPTTVIETPVATTEPSTVTETVVTKTELTPVSETAEAVAPQLAAVPILGEVSTNEPIVIDNDEAVEMESTIKYEDLPTDEGKTRVKTGAKFPVVISSQITTKTAKKGDPIEARLKYDLKIGDRLIAKKGAVVNGHINYSLPARSTMHSLVSTTRWYRNSGCVGISFDEIINDKGEHLPLVAVPARAARFVKNKGEGRELGINHDGQVAGPLSQQIRYKALRIGLNAAMAPAGALSFGAMPIALGVIGAANPSFAFMKPVGLNVRHRRIKGFLWGALGGVPGSWLIEDTVVRGQEAIIKPGDEFLAEFQQEFTGEPASEASMMPNAKSKVHGQVMPDNKKQKDKN
jgi:hypothetical protein